MGKTKTFIEVTISGVYSKYVIISKSLRHADLKELDKQLSAQCVVLTFSKESKREALLSRHSGSHLRKWNNRLRKCPFCF